MLNKQYQSMETSDSTSPIERELAEKTRLLEIALNAVDQGFIVWDEDDRVIIANERQAELWDYPKELLEPGTPAIELFRYQASIGAYGEGDPEELAQARYEYILATREQGEDEATTASGRILRCRRFMVDGLGWAATYTDITDLKKSETALHASEERYLQAAHALNLGYWVWDHLNDRCISCSEELAKMHGVSVEKYLAATDSLAKELEWIHPEDTPRVHAANSGAEAYDIEFRIVLRDGQVRRVREIGWPELDSDGKVIRSSGIMQDITEIRRVEEALRHSEETYKQAAEMAKLSHWVWDEVNDRCSFVSEEHVAIFGISTEEYLATANEQMELEWTHPDDREHYAQVLDSANAPGESYQVEFRIVRPADGNVIHLRESGILIGDEEGNLTETWGTTQDVSDLKQMEQRLKASEKSIRDLLEGSPVGISVVSSADTRHLMFNQAYMEILGAKSPEELDKRDFSTTWADPAVFEHVVDIFRKGGRIVDFEAERTRIDDGSSRWVLHNSLSTEFEGELARVG